MQAAHPVSRQRYINLLRIGEVQPRHHRPELLLGPGQTRVVPLLLAHCTGRLT